MPIARFGNPPSARRPPEECSLGTSPRKLIHSRGESNRLRSPTSASTVIAVTHSTPRNAINPSTTGRNDHSCTPARICSSNPATGADRVGQGEVVA